MSGSPQSRRIVQKILIRFVQRKGVVGGLDGLVRLVSVQPRLATGVEQWVQTHRLELGKLGLSDRGVTRDVILDYCREVAGTDHTRFFVRPSGLEPVRQLVSSTPTAQLPRTESVEELIVDLGSDKPKSRLKALRALRRIGQPAAEAAPQVVALLSDEESHVRRSAASTLGELGPSAVGSVPELRELLKSNDRHLRRVAADALRRMQQDDQIDIPVEDLGCDPKWLTTAPYDEIAATTQRIAEANLDGPKIQPREDLLTVLMPSPIWEPGAGGKVARRRCRLHKHFLEHYYVGEVAERLRRPESLDLVAKAIHHHRTGPHVLLRIVDEVEGLYASEHAPLETLEDPYRPLDKLTSLVLASFARATRAGLTTDELATMAALPGSGSGRDSAIGKLQALYRQESEWHAQAIDEAL